MRETEKQRPGVREISRSSRSIAKCSSRAVALDPCAGIVPVNMVGDHVPQGLDDCELIKFSNLPNTHFKHSSMVVIRDSATPIDCSVFPPNNHENLHLHEREEHPLSPSLSYSSASLSSSSLSPSSSFSPSDTDSSDPESPLPSDARVQKTGGKANSWLSIGFEVLRSKLLAFASSFGYNGGGIRWRIQSFGSTAWVVAMVVMLWSFYMRGRHRRRSRENLMLVVKEKDEKIDKLLHQIAEMNELLIARHRLVAN